MSKFSSIKNREEKTPGFGKTLEGGAFYVMLIFVCLILFFVWSSYAEISRIVRVEGKIVPAGKSQKIQHLEGGILSEIYVQEGDFVHKGDKLLAIDNTQAGANLSETNVKIVSLRAKAARLKAEAEGLETLELPNGIKGSEEFKAEMDLFYARLKKLENEIKVEKSVLLQREAEFKELKHKKSRLATELSTANDRYQVIHDMSASGSASKLEIIEAKSRQQNLLTEMGDIEGSLPQIEAAISESQNRIEQNITKFRADSQAEYVSVVSEIERLKQVATAANDKLSRTEVSASADGIINTVFINTIGGVIKGGDVLIELTPVTDKIVIEAKASPDDRGFIHPGLEARVRLNSYDVAEYGFLNGIVAKAGADSLQDARGQEYFQVNISVNEVSPQLKGREIIPGMLVSADIVTGERTILKYLLSPVSKFSYNFLSDPR